MKKTILSFALMLVGMSAFAQKEVRSNLRQGNDAFDQGNFSDAELAYRKSLEVDPNSNEATYNLGNSLFRQEKFEDAAKQYQQITQQSEDVLMQAMAFHNAGNIFMAAEDYGQAIEAFKQSLRRNPKDNETRYNLALAQKLLQDQQQQQQQQQDQKDQEQQQEDKQEQQDKQDQQQQDQQEKEQEQNKDQQQDQQNQQDQQEQQQDQQQGQQPQNQISKEAAEQILKALNQDEKEVQEKVKQAQMQQIQQRKTEKDW